MITAELIKVISPRMPPDAAAAIARHLQHYASEAGITTRARVAAFLAQLAHESAGFRYREEIWGPTWAQRRYEWRRDLGNVRRGDGYRYRGRGWIQLTGRANYTRYRDEVQVRFGVDILLRPDYATRTDIACYLAVAYWRDHKLNLLADRDMFTAITRKINGGYNGLADRKRYWYRLLRSLKNG